MAGLFQSAQLTQKGIALLAKAQGGRCAINLTKAASGNGTYSSGEVINTRTALKSQKQTQPIESVKIQNQTNVNVKFVITNHPAGGPDLANGYYVTEIGLFATDPDEGEILFAIAIGTPNQYDYMPAYNDLVPSTITVNFLTEVDNADTVTFEVPDNRYFYDQTTGDAYIIGIDNGLLYYEEV